MSARPHLSSNARTDEANAGGSKSPHTSKRLRVIGWVVTLALLTYFMLVLTRGGVQLTADALGYFAGAVLALCTLYWLFVTLVRSRNWSPGKKSILATIVAFAVYFVFPGALRFTVVLIALLIVIVRWIRDRILRRRAKGS